MTTLLVLGCAVGAALCTVLAARGWLLVTTQPSVPRYFSMSERRRRAARLPKDEKGPLSKIVESVGRPFAGLLGSLLGPERTERYRQRLGRSGRAGAVPVEVYLARKAGSVILFGLFAVVFFFARQWFLGVVFLLIGWFWLDLMLWAYARRRATEIEKALPDFLDVLSVTVSAGLGFRRALWRVCESMPGPLAEEFTLALQQMDLGTSRRDALRQIRSRTSSPTLSQFLTAILQAEELGAPLSDALIEISVDMRRNTSQEARRRAARTAPRIQLVVTFLMVPAALILLLGAIILSMSQGGGVGVLG
ncbi:MAG: type II secretion system (T2SS), F family protein [Streptosporangiales bacterium]|nr:type II secretion system (T2SS), F family protein [Streptosporangiales bacterium]